MEQYYGTGRRKTSTARVFLRPGQGNYKVNGKTADQYFLTPTRRSQVKLPLQVAQLAEKFDVLINVTGGGNGRHMVYAAGKTDHTIDGKVMVDHIVELVEQKAAAIDAANATAPAPQLAAVH